MKPRRLGHVKASGSWSQGDASKGPLEPCVKVWSSQAIMMAPLQWGRCGRRLGFHFHRENQVASERGQALEVHRKK